MAVRAAERCVRIMTVAVENGIRAPARPRTESESLPEAAAGLHGDEATDHRRHGRRRATKSQPAVRPPDNAPAMS